ncbi:nuclear pore complex protein NUP35-like [Typha latifolia]|uniref:nuclear pore complex protein NUP35-like n=1 Tax=Typha latifolia TaxID=4733 RepID=UPI003C2DFB96
MRINGYGKLYIDAKTLIFIIHTATLDRLHLLVESKKTKAADRKTQKSPQYFKIFPISVPLKPFFASRKKEAEEERVRERERGRETMSSSSFSRSSRSAPRQSLFYRDLASPICNHHRGGGRSPPATSALWRDGLASGADPPPPPMFTLDDRADFSPDTAVGDLPPSSPSSRTPPRPDRRSFSRSPSLSSPSSSSALRIRAEASGSGSGVGNGGASSNWMITPAREDGLSYLEKGNGSPVEGVVETGALLALPPPTKDVARMEDSEMTNGAADEEWVTVFGFFPSDTNLVLREFEKCGVIIRHFPGPREANWMHILYQHHYDARKALEKNGTQLNGALTIGVKPVDQIQRQLLNERLQKINRGGFMVNLPPKMPAVKSTAAPSALGAFPRPYHPKADTNIISDSGRRATGSIASPAKSVVSKVMDLVFGI